MTCRGTQRWQRLRNDEAVFASIFGSNLALARYPWIAHFFLACCLPCWVSTASGG
jgi:hypothetical protein